MEDKSKQKLQGVHWWVLLAFTFSLLGTGESSPRSPLWLVEYLLYALLFVGLWNYRSNGKLFELPLIKKAPLLTYVVFAWVLGMLVESTITITGEGIGGCHQHTIPSYILAQGIYIPLIIAIALMTRKMSLSFPQTYYLAAGMGLVETLVFRPVALNTLLSPFFLLTPLSLGYGMNIYAKFLATPFLLLSSKSLWSEDTQERNPITLLTLGFLSGFILYVFWGSVYGPLMSWWFGFPPLIAEELS